ncbi:lysophospholipid acyltransferase family protein [Streptomyces niveus]|uniref:lysophospholipid acyltransferase family protein n=1 Tax=Streptomyces niveus TaxID=193462 RepID=UPI00339DD2BA
MLSRTAAALVPFFGRLTVTLDGAAELAPGSIVAANHTSLSDPAIVLAALHRLGVEPVVMAAAGLWRVPLLGRALAHDGHIPVRRADPRAAACLEDAAAALARGRLVVIYGEGGIPDFESDTETPPHPFRSGLARLAAATGAPVVPLGQTGARRIMSGSGPGQFTSLASAPLRRPELRVHIGAPVRLTGDLPAATAQAHAAVTAAWRAAGGRAVTPPAPAQTPVPDSAPAPAVEAAA